MSVTITTGIAGLVYFVPAGADVPAYLGEAVSKLEPALSPVDGKTSGKLVSIFSGDIGATKESHDWFPMSQEVSGLKSPVSSPDQRPETRDARLFLGIAKGFKPSPEMFVRFPVRRGYGVTLADGNAWTIPVALLDSPHMSLPRSRTLRPDGTAGWNVDTAYRGLSDFAHAIFAARTGGERPPLTDDELDFWCGEALAVNYRLHRSEALVLGLLNDTGIATIIDAILDWPTMMDAAQKKSG